MYKLIIFDLDGTLLDTSKGIVASIESALLSNGKRIPTVNVLKSFIGPPLKVSFGRMPDIEDSEADKLVADFRKKYRAGDMFLAELYDGILDLLKDLHGMGIELAIATYKPQDMAVKLAGEFAIGNYFTVISGADCDGRKTKADIVREVIDKYPLYDREDILMIGDSYSDAEAAKLQNISFLGAAYGFEIRNTPGDKKRTEAIGIVDEAQHIRQYIGQAGRT